MDRREAPGRKRMAIRSPDGAAPYLLTPNTLAAVSSPVPAHHLRALRVRAIGRVQPLAERRPAGGWEDAAPMTQHPISLPPSTPVAVSSPVPGHHLRALRLRAILKMTGRLAAGGARC